jgi:hypothetical protein
MTPGLIICRRPATMMLIRALRVNASIHHLNEQAGSRVILDMNFRWGRGLILTARGGFLAILVFLGLLMQRVETS